MGLSPGSGKGRYRPLQCPIYTTVEAGQMLTARTVRILCGYQEGTPAVQPGPQVTALQSWAHTVQFVKSTD